MIQQQILKMIHLKTYENFNFEKGTFVKLSNKAIKNFLSNIKNFSMMYPETQKISRDELKNKIFYISRIDKIYDRDSDNYTLEYNLINIDSDDEFFWGGTSEENIRLLSEEEKAELELKKAAKTYNI